MLVRSKKTDHWYETTEVNEVPDDHLMYLIVWAVDCETDRELAIMPHPFVPCIDDLEIVEDIKLKI